MKKIMFNDRYGLTTAVLSGRKTQTRRIIPPKLIEKINQFQEEYYEASLDRLDGKELIEAYFINKPHRLSYKVGEIIAVAQSYKDAGYSYCLSSAPWTNKMFTKAEYMPHRIRITNVRIERLNEISELDCIAEGVEKVAECESFFRIPIFHKSGSITYLSGETPRETYAALIDKISGKGTWQSNPHVFAYEFELVK